MKTLTFLIGIFSLVLISCNTPKEVSEPDSEAIRLNQVGYYPRSVKQFVVADIDATTFDVINEKNVSVFSGTLTDSGTWDQSGEKVLSGDFSSLTKEGKYRIMLDNGIASFPFEIKSNLYDEALKAAVKSYYFQRASMPIEEKYGGVFHRAAGHPDNRCIFHPSTGKEGTLNSPRGWYDAGDYGKYVANAALSAGQMLNLLEQYPEVLPDNSLNIPESGNNIGDLWDELKYELDWILTMQDDDGGVFHKLTALNFAGFVMPEDYDLDRYIIGKGTFSSLTFAAVMAQASRLYNNFYPEWSAKALQAAEKAWQWSVENNDVVFQNPSDVATGQYGDRYLDDDFFWAAAELLVTTGNKQYFDHLKAHQQEHIHKITNSWMFYTRNMGFHTLLENRDKLDAAYAEELVKNQLKLADEILENLSKNPYHIALDWFEWGSNSDILNQAQILCYAHRLTGDNKYLEGAIQNTDYIFGKNATAYSFLTGFGSKQAMHPHHRPSGADGIEAPVPGFIIGGPNKDKQDRAGVKYPKNVPPAKAYMDVQESYASNEVCLNWNAPAVFVLGYLEEVCQ